MTAPLAGDRPPLPLTTPGGQPRCMATADGMACARPAKPAHDVHDDRNFGLWILERPPHPDRIGLDPGYRLLVAETAAQEEARYRFWFGEPPRSPMPGRPYPGPARRTT